MNPVQVYYFLTVIFNLAVSMFTGTCQDIGSCSSLSAFCQTNPSIANMCPVTCEINGCSSANSVAPVTLWVLIWIFNKDSLLKHKSALIEIQQTQ